MGPALHSSHGVGTGHCVTHIGLNQNLILLSVWFRRDSLSGEAEGRSSLLAAAVFLP